MPYFWKAFIALLSAIRLSEALSLNISDQGWSSIFPLLNSSADNIIASIRDAASTVAYGLMKYYTGNITNTPATVGILPAPLYWYAYSYSRNFI